MSRAKIYSYDKIGQETSDERKRLLGQTANAERGSQLNLLNFTNLFKFLVRAKMGIFLAIVLVSSFFIFSLGVLFHRHLMQVKNF